MSHLFYSLFISISLYFSLSHKIFKAQIAFILPPPHTHTLCCHSLTLFHLHKFLLSFTHINTISLSLSETKQKRKFICNKILQHNCLIYFQGKWIAWNDSTIKRTIVTFTNPPLQLLQCVTNSPFLNRKEGILLVQLYKSSVAKCSRKQISIQWKIHVNQPSWSNFITVRLFCFDCCGCWFFSHFW